MRVNRSILFQVGDYSVYCTDILASVKLLELKAEVIGATINKTGLLKIRATKVGQDTVLSQIINLVEEARTGKAQVQRMVDQVAK
ncbi:MAG: hypothetical protein WCC79_02505, partial [Nitrososphaeraceae archaeon]